jgi:phenylacetate-coenzyme A ligase PaaK-like adenylate-forming protein
LDTLKSFESQLYTVNDNSFEDIALQLFRFQAENNAIYRNFIRNLGIQTDKIYSLNDIPFLPISFFKHQVIKTGEWQPETTFASSGTTGVTTSTHLIQSLKFYQEHSVRCFEYFFGPVTDYHFLALLPSYLERKDSSLVAMMDFFIKKSESPRSGFYLHNTAQLIDDLEKLKKDTRKTIFWGVSFALLDLAEAFTPDLSHCMVFETGGMKGRRNEITRQELHEKLCQGFNITQVYSEYGMTELLSQSYTRGKERFYCPPWKKIIGRDTSDPMLKGLHNEMAGINVIDLANRHSIAFIETEDVGKSFADGAFEVLGRFDNSDVRGCNLLVE